MTREEFISVLDEKSYLYKIERDKIIVIPYEIGMTYLDLSELTSLPPGVEFRNNGDVNLSSLVILPSDIVFKNHGYVWFSSIKGLSRSVGFKNDGHVNLAPLIRGVIDDWEGNIDGIDPKMLLNLMIKRGLFI
jgi:hypothetical protein